MLLAMAVVKEGLCSACGWIGISLKNLFYLALISKEFVDAMLLIIWHLCSVGKGSLWRIILTLLPPMVRLCLCVTQSL